MRNKNVIALDDVGLFQSSVFEEKTRLPDPFPAICELAVRADEAQNPVLIYQNHRILEKSAVAQFAWTVPKPGNDQSSECEHSARLLVDRYGGFGVGPNGGSGRAARIGAFQIKGVGPTPLANSVTDAQHRHGGMTLADCISEAIWGEILSFALPYGACRCVAVLSVDGHCRWDHDPMIAEENDRYVEMAFAPRGLYVRMAPIRPAHFLRNHKYDLSRDGVRADIARVKAAVEAADQLFRYRSVADADQEQQGPVAALHAFCDRLAAQASAARARRIWHGSITPSNIDLSGRWLDFSTTSGLPDWSDLAGQYNVFWDIRPYRQLINDLCDSFAKHSPLGAVIEKERSQLLTSFNRRLCDSQTDDFAALSGLPIRLSMCTADEALELTAFSDTIIELCRFGNDKPRPVPYPSDPTPNGPADVVSILRDLGDADDREGALRSEAICQKIATLKQRYHRVRLISLKYASHAGVSVRAHDKLARMEAVKAAQATECFFRGDMFEQVNNIVLESADMAELCQRASELICKTSRQAKMKYERAGQYSSTILLNDNHILSYNAVTDRVETTDRLLI